MKKNHLLVAIPATIAMLVSCMQHSESQSVQISERPITSISLMGSDTIWNAGVQPNTPGQICAKEWLIQNTGADTLVIDSVIPSCESIELIYESSKPVTPMAYFPVRALLQAEGTVGHFFHEIKLYGNFEGSPLTLGIEGEYMSFEEQD